MQTSPICDSGKEDHLRISNKINLHGSGPHNRF